MPTFGSLFAGIGGIDLGLERAGWNGRWQVEWDDYCQRVLAKHWPDVPRVGDIHDAHARWACPMAYPERLGPDGVAEAAVWNDGYGHDSRWAEETAMADAERAGLQGRAGSRESSEGRTSGESAGCCPGCLEPVDLLAGGFPCQPFSVAGKRLGKADDRWLWPEFARLIGELRPRYVLVENVPGLLAGHGGMGAVLGDLASIGYDAEWDSIPAAAVGAPHLRYRVWIVAHANGAPVWEQPVGERGSGGAPIARCDGTLGPLADTDRVDAQGLISSVVDQEERGGPVQRPFGPRGDGDGWWLTEPDVGGALDGFPAWLDRRRERLVTPHMLDLAYAVDGGPREALRLVRGDAGQAAVRDQVGGSGGVSSSEVLLSYVRELERHVDEGRLPLARPTAPEASVRGVREDEGAPRPSRRRGAVAQRSGQSPDALHALSQLLARDAGAAWAAYRREDAEPVLSRWAPGWEDGIPRVAPNVPARVDRLRALGNAVVPQVVEVIGRRILEADALT